VAVPCVSGGHVGLGGDPAERVPAFRQGPLCATNPRCPNSSRSVRPAGPTTTDTWKRGNACGSTNYIENVKKIEQHLVWARDQISIPAA
jgi:hypothetical protein